MVVEKREGLGWRALGIGGHYGALSHDYSFDFVNMPLIHCTVEPRYNKVPRDRTIYLVIMALITCFQNILNCTIQSVLFVMVKMLLNYVICT